MAASTKLAAKIAALLCLFSATAFSDNTLPTQEDVNGLAEQAEQITDSFMRESFLLRMNYQYYDSFPTPQDRDNLYGIAKKAGDDLQVVADKQQDLKKQIEDYQGDDWDDRFGSTNLWRKLLGDIHKTALYKCEIDFYRTLSAAEPQKKESLQTLLNQIDSFSSFYKYLPELQLFKIKVLTLLAQTAPEYKAQAKDAIDSFVIYPGTPCEFEIKKQILKIKLSHLTDPNQLSRLTDYLFKNNCTDDTELILSAAFLQRQYDPNLLEKTLRLKPQIEPLFGSILLSDLSRKQITEQTLQQITLFEAELAAQAAWQNEPKNYQSLLANFAGKEEFQTPLILYVTAMAYAESSPAKAVELLIKASRLQNLQKSDKLNVDACKIAEQATRLAYNLFRREEKNCPLALEAFDNYRLIAGKKTDAELEYLYSVVLNNCGRADEGRKLLREMAGGPPGYWRNRAKLDLMAQNIQQNAQEILTILNDAEMQSNPDLNILKSQALQQLGRLDESVDCFLRAIEPDSCEYTDAAMALLAGIVDKIDSLEFEANDFLKMMWNCEKLAQSCYDCLDGPRQYTAGLFLAEVAVFAADKERQKLSATDKLLNKLAENEKNTDADLLRCRARLLTAQADFERAARLWAKICEMRKDELPQTGKRSFEWWQGKFYELYCWANCAATEKKDVLHTIEVLENSFPGIPPLWIKKLNLLKENCL